MAKLSYSQQAQKDLERLTDFLAATDINAALQTIDLIEEAVTILKRHPMMHA